MKNEAEKMDYYIFLSTIITHQYSNLTYSEQKKRF